MTQTRLSQSRFRPLPSVRETAYRTTGTTTSAGPLPRPHPGARFTTLSTNGTATLRCVRAQRSGIILITHLGVNIGRPSRVNFAHSLTGAVKLAK